MCPLLEDFLTMIVLPNPFMNSADDTPSVESAAAPDLGRSFAAAVPIAESFTTMEVYQEAPAAAASPVDAGATDFDINGTDCINEIFWFIQNKLKPAPSRFEPDLHGLVDWIDDETAPRAVIGTPTWEEPPIFLRRRA
jgi:hypothetical protein